ncbi:MAG: hypothetical protein KDA20_09670 [Phycisphaerales bacterium]|nr:hypothetical protein [Phycisphaerales bacterium]
MKSFGGVIGSVVAGVIGAVVWAAIAYFTGFQIGWVAWGIGGLVGAGCLIGLHLSGGQPSEQTAILAGVVALLSILLGKSALVEIAYRSAVVPPEAVVSYVADEVVVEREQAGQRVVWPAGVDPTQAFKRSDYPRGIWEEASRRLGEMSHDERLAFERDVRRRYFGNRVQRLTAAATPYDAIWVMLALFTAYKLAAAGER